MTTHLEEGGSIGAVVEVEGVVDADDVPAICELIGHSAQPLTIDLHEAEISDLALTRLAAELPSLVTSSLRGLSRHQERLLRYLDGRAAPQGLE